MSIFFFYAILSPLLWALVNIIDDYQIKKLYKHPSTAVIMTGIFLVIPFIFSLTYASDIKWSHGLVGFISGVLIVISNWFYFKSLANENTAVVIGLWNLSPIFVYILSVIFLNESLEERQFFGSIIVLCSSAVISLLGNRKYHLSPAFGLMLMASLLYASSAIFEKQSYIIFEDFYSSFLFINLGMIVTSALFLFNKENYREVKSILSLRRSYLLFIVVSEIINISAVFFQNKAISLGSITLVKVIESVQPVFVLLITMILAIVFPFYKKGFDKTTLLPRLIVMFVMVLGFTMLYL